MLSPSREGQIKAKAIQLGFAKVGIARAMPLSNEGDRLREWLDRGYQASMGWMGRRAEERMDISRVLAGARSVISVAMNYFTPFAHTQEAGTGKVSRYAWGSDYHSVLGERIADLGRWIESEFPEAKTRWYVDTGPVMEKAWAQRAGIGWLGKHTNVISRELGSWIFLGEVITTLDLQPDEPATDHCGSCTSCIEACPTSAIVAPYLVDSNLCISYLTIEHRGEIPEPLGKKFEGWIFGCDVCQDVCPWNQKFAQVTPEAAFLPREGHVSPEVSEWGELTDKQFDTRFADSPIRRARIEGLKRNISLCQENDPNPDSGSRSES